MEQNTNIALRNLSPRSYQTVYGILCGLFFVVIGLHILSNRPLWLDENFLLANLTQLNGFELFSTLDHAQAFPRIHLIFIQAFARPFDDALWALRLSSILCMSAAFIVWAGIYRKEFSHPGLALAAIFSFAASYRLTYYAYEFKPYACDVLVIALFVKLILHQSRKSMPRYRETVALLLFPFLVFFSYAAVFAVGIVTWNTWRLSKSNHDRFRALGNTALTFLCLSGLYWTDLRHSLHIKPLMEYWDSYFLCTESAGCFFDTLGDGVKKLAIYWQGTDKTALKAGSVFVPFFIFPLLILGIRHLWRSRGVIGDIPSVALILFAELFVLGLFKKYPFTGERVTLFFAPIAYFLILEGIRRLSAWGRLGKGLSSALLGYYVIYNAACLVMTVRAHLSAFGL